MTDETIGLVELSEAGDHAAFQQLLARYGWRLAMLINRRGGRALRADCDAEDIFQQAVAHAWQLLPSYRDQGAGSFYRWLSKITLNTIHDRLRYLDAKGRGDVRHFESFADTTGSHARQPIDPTMTAASAAASREWAGKLAHAFERLEADVRSVVELHFFEGMSFSEIATALGIGKTTAFERLAEGVSRLRSLVGPLD
ncbi:MAG: sigma-70 family RNA polymerase sigma factor [Planctomycetota bacterium]